MLLKIDSAVLLGGHLFLLRFNNGREGTVDLRLLPELGPGVAFEPLKDVAFLQRFELKYGTLCWPGEIDVAPEFLYFLAFREDPGLHDQFVDWGYLPEAARR